MTTSDNNDLVAPKNEMWSNLSDLARVVATVYDDAEQRARKGKAKIVYEEDGEDSNKKKLFTKAPKKFDTRRYPQHQHYENLNGASSSSSSSSRLRLRSFDQHMVYDKDQRGKKQQSKTFSDEYDDEPSKKKRIFDQNLNGDPSSSSYSSSRLRIRWSEPFSSPLLLYHNTYEQSEKTETKTPPSLNSQSSPSLRLTESKSHGVSQRRDIGGLKTAKIAPFQTTARAMPWWLVPVVIEMKGIHPMLILEKTLFGSDVKPYESSFSMPWNRLIRKDFLTAVEMRILKEEIDNEVGAILVDPRSVKWGVFLKRLVLKNHLGNESWTFSLTCGWSDVVEANELKDGDNIGFWSFRCRGILCFALVPLPPAMGRTISSFLL